MNLIGWRLPGTRYLTMVLHLAVCCTGAVGAQQTGSIPSADPSSAQKKAPSFSPAGMVGTTAPSGYSSGASEEISSQAMDLVVGLPFQDSLLIATSEAEITCAAEDSLLGAVHDRPASFEANHQLGLFYLQHDEPARSAQYLGTAAKIAPDNTINSRELIYANLAAGQFSAAILLLRDLELRNIKDPALRIALAEAYAALGQRPMAIAEYRTAAELDPSEENIFANGLGLLRLGAANEANAIFTPATIEYPTSARLWLGRGISESLQLRKQQAVASLLRAADLDSDYEPTYSLLANLCGVSADTDAKITTGISRFVAAHPNSGTAHYDYAEVLFAEERAAPAADLARRVESEFKSAIARNPDLAPAHFGLGVAYYQAGRYAEAIAELRLAVRLNPNNSQWHYRLFKAYQADKQEELAEMELKKFETMRAGRASQADGTETTVQELGSRILPHGNPRVRCHPVNP